MGFLLARELAARGFRVCAFDPAGMAHARRELGQAVQFVLTAEECIAGSEIVIVATPWKEFLEIPAAIWGSGGGGRVVVDCWRGLKDVEGCGRRAVFEFGDWSGGVILDYDFCDAEAIRRAYRHYSAECDYRWTRLSPRPEIILFGDEIGTAEFARESGLRHIPQIRRNEKTTPFWMIFLRRRNPRHRSRCLLTLIRTLFSLMNFSARLRRWLPGGRSF